MHALHVPGLHKRSGIRIVFCGLPEDRGMEVALDCLSPQTCSTVLVRSRAHSYVLTFDHTVALDPGHHFPTASTDLCPHIGCLFGSRIAIRISSARSLSGPSSYDAHCSPILAHSTAASAL